MKYPRTYHLPWSPGATSDDKILKPGWFDSYKGEEIVCEHISAEEYFQMN